MDKKILVSMMLIGLVSALAGAGLYAYFSDTETSEDNIFSAGTINISLEQSPTLPVVFKNMAPGDTAEGTITIRNIGSLAGHLYATASYEEADNTYSTEDTVDKSADEFAKMLIILSYKYNGIEIKGQIPDVDGDGRTTIYDMVNDRNFAFQEDGIKWYSYDSNFVSGETATFYLQVQFDPAAGNEYQNDGISLDFGFLLKQA